MPQDRGDLPPAFGTPAPTAAGFDEVFSAAAASPGIRRVWELAEPDLPPQIEPFSFVSAGLLRHVAQALDLSPGQTLVDLGCGRGGPGMWLARQADVSLVGVDFSPVGVDQAAHRAALFGLAGRARFVVGDLTHTPRPTPSTAVSGTWGSKPQRGRLRRPRLPVHLDGRDQLPDRPRRPGSSSACWPAPRKACATPGRPLTPAATPST
jgi:SAM-dependent methyltransferase